MPTKSQLHDQHDNKVSKRGTEQMMFAVLRTLLFGVILFYVGMLPLVVLVLFYEIIMLDMKQKINEYEGRLWYAKIIDGFNHELNISAAIDPTHISNLKSMGVDNHLYFGWDKNGIISVLESLRGKDVEIGSIERTAHIDGHDSHYLYEKKAEAKINESVSIINADEEGALYNLSLDYDAPVYA